ncbi:MAG: hypothetical protein HY748_04790 [Elusimicrobia bacterium]|nr:hypothetical protein [Elusimicrobiota bacterium]
MRFAYAQAFLKGLASLAPSHARRLLRAVEKFEAGWEVDHFPTGAGLTHLRGSFFEFRVDARRRVVFERHGDEVRYLLYGSHDEIRRFLKRF